jgi:uracil-DNA glycosylase
MTDRQVALRDALELEIAMLGPYAPLGRPRSVTAVGPPADEDRRYDVSLPTEAPAPADVYERIAAAIPEASPLRALHTLAEVEAYVAETVLIDLDAARQNPVFGVGNPTADLLVIGEAPGADEDRLGEPFVGRAGQLLTKILAAIEFTREDVYIANILKSRPPDNRPPHRHEIEAHLPILLKQIVLIRPKIILCVGKTAGNSLLNNQDSLAALRARGNDFYGIPVVVTYHPAALLRNPEWKRPTWEDVQRMKSDYDRLTAPAA